MQQHECEQRHRLGFGQQFDQQACEAYGFRRQIRARERISGRRRIPLVELQIDHAQHAVEAFGEFIGRRHCIGNFRLADFGFGAHDALRHRRRPGQRRSGDFLGGQAADLAQRQCHLRVGCECRMAAGKNQPQAIVFDFIAVGRGALVDNVVRCIIIERGKTRAAPQRIDRLETTRRNQPGARIGWQAFNRLLLECRAKGLVHRLFGPIEVAGQAHQRGEHAARFGTLDRVDLRLHRVGVRCAHVKRLAFNAVIVQHSMPAATSTRRTPRRIIFLRT